jgi:hypothetical protein
LCTDDEHLSLRKRSSFAALDDEPDEVDEKKQKKKQARRSTAARKKKNGDDDADCSSSWMQTIGRVSIFLVLVAVLVGVVLQAPEKRQTLLDMFNAVWAASDAALEGILGRR